MAFDVWCIKSHDMFGEGLRLGSLHKSWIWIRKSDVLDEEDNSWAGSWYRELVIRYANVDLAWPTDPGRQRKQVETAGEKRKLELSMRWTLVLVALSDIFMLMRVHRPREAPTYVCVKIAYVRGQKSQYSSVFMTYLRQFLEIFVIFLSTYSIFEDWF